MEKHGLDGAVYPPYTGGMNTPRLIASFLLAVPVFAQAAPHTIVVSISNGQATYAHTTKAGAGEQANFVGKVGGKNVINNLFLSENGGVTALQYQTEVGGGGQTFEVQSSLRIRPGERVRAVECGGWKLDISLDAAGTKGAPLSAPGASNLSLTTFVGKRTCKVISQGDVQSNIVDAKTVGGRKSGFILNAVVGAIAGGASKVEFQLENTPVVATGETSVPVGKKTAASGGKVSFLLEGSAPAASAPAPQAAPAAPANRDEGGPIPLLR